MTHNFCPPILDANNDLALPLSKEMCVESLSTGRDYLMYLTIIYEHTQK